MRIAINGFGLVGQVLARRLRTVSPLKLLAVNEARLSRDECQHRFLSGICPKDRGAYAAMLRHIHWFQESEPANLPWSRLGVDVVLEAAEFFRRTELEVQASGGLVCVLMTGDLRDGLPDLTVVPGINDSDLKPEHRVLCAGSDRTQALCPILDCLHRSCTVEQFAACVERPPYRVRPWGISHRETDVEQLGRVLPWVRDRGWTCRLEDPHVTLARIRLAVHLGRAVSVEMVQEILQDAARLRFPTSMLVADTFPAVAGSRYSCLIDTTRLRTAGTQLWIETMYDPLESYVARLIDILARLEAISPTKATTAT